MKQINKTVREHALEYRTEWQVMWDYVKKINRNDKKLAKYAVEARQRLGSDDYEYAQRMVSDIAKYRESLMLKIDRHKEEAGRIRALIISLNPYKKCNIANN